MGKGHRFKSMQRVFHEMQDGALPEAVGGQQWGYSDGKRQTRVNLPRRAEEPGVYGEGQRKPSNAALEKNQYVQVISGKQEMEAERPAVKEQRIQWSK